MVIKIHLFATQNDFVNKFQMFSLDSCRQKPSRFVFRSETHLWTGHAVNTKLYLKKTTEEYF